MIIIIDYHAGNLRSVQKALQSVGADARIASSPNELRPADKVVFPGVGAFGKAMEALEQLKYIDAIHEFIKSGRPFLGICLGLQLMFESSEENPGVKGLSLLPGHVKRFPDTLKVPHLGWNVLKQTRTSPLWKDIPSDSYFYFAHSYYIHPEEREIVVGETEYGENIEVAIRYENMYGLQFHPEKSQHMGLQVLKNFVEL